MKINIKKTKATKTCYNHKHLLPIADRIEQMSLGKHRIKCPVCKDKMASFEILEK
jgi:Zn finger protein HypA/HybF involved in hydrogenase expression